jgi:hypothetical protein
MLFTEASEIPVPPEPVRPRAAEQMAPFDSVLTAAEAIALRDLTPGFVGRTVTVGGERRPPEALMSSDALLDDGTAVIGLATDPSASRTMRESLASRFLLVTGTVRDRDGELQVLVERAGDLRSIAREWRSHR